MKGNKDEMLQGQERMLEHELVLLDWQMIFFFHLTTTTRQECTKTFGLVTFIVYQ